MSAVLLLFGATFIYAGILMSPTDSGAGIACALVGLLLIVKPCWDVVQRLRARPGHNTKAGRRNRGQGKERHLKLVKRDEEQPPTIH